MNCVRVHHCLLNAILQGDQGQRGIRGLTGSIGITGPSGPKVGHSTAANIFALRTMEEHKWKNWGFFNSHCQQGEPGAPGRVGSPGPPGRVITGPKVTGLA